MSGPYLIREAFDGPVLVTREEGHDLWHLTGVCWDETEMVLIYELLHNAGVHTERHPAAVSHISSQDMLMCQKSRA